MTEITFNKKEIDKAMERLDSFEEKPLKRKRRQLISGSFIYDEEDVAQAVDRLKARTLTEKTFYDMTLKKTFLCISLEDFDEIFGDLK